MSATLPRPPAAPAAAPAAVPSPAAEVPAGRSPDRLGGLRRFAVAITVLNVLGHTLLGFEQALVQPLAAVLAAYATEIGLDRVDAWARRRPPRFAGGWRERVDFLLSAHISGLAVAMLLYANARVGPVVFAAVAAIASKSLFRTGQGARARHVFNPSNLGIAATLLLFPWVGIAPPYQFTENLPGGWAWLLPAVIVCTGTMLNARFTGRLPLVAAWAGGFALQAALRAGAHGTPLAAGLLPMTGVAFLLFSFYMVTDPATTPQAPRAQVAFGAGVAAVYGALMTLHVVFGLFFALAVVCSARWALLAAAERAPQARRAVARLHLPIPVARGDAGPALAARHEP
jgi:enediyne biosynthesis protein E5